jgi:ArsR family transcriptional regulator
MTSTTTRQRRPVSLAPADTAEEAVAVLRFLSDATRLRILTYLARQNAYVLELSEHLALPQPLVSYHLRRLRELALVRDQRNGQRVYYALDRAAWTAFTQPLHDICDLLELPAAGGAPRTGTPSSATTSPRPTRPRPGRGPSALPTVRLTASTARPAGRIINPGT